MLTFLALAGRLVSPLLAFVPGLNPKVLMFLASCLAVLTVIGGPAGAVWLHMHGEVKAAATAEKTACELRIATTQASAERTIADILAEAAEHQGPKSSAEVVALCRAKPALCRDGDAK
jgi:hypothetical protein